MTHAPTQKKGFGMVEILVGSAILLTVIIASVGVISQIRDLERRTTSVIRANYLLLEGIDVAKILRDNGWTSNVTTLSLDTPYYLVWSSSAWGATTVLSVIDGFFYRTISFSAVYRDGSDNIATSGTLDAGTLLITSSVSWWFDGATTTKTFQTYITDLYGN